MEQDVAVVEPLAEPAESPGPRPADEAAEPEVAEELLVEEVSIDGMCGVY